MKLSNKHAISNNKWGREFKQRMKPTCLASGNVSVDLISKEIVGEVCTVKCKHKLSEVNAEQFYALKRIYESNLEQMLMLYWSEYLTKKA